MTLGEITQEVGELSLRQPAHDLNLKGYINRAQRAIAQRANWTFLHEVRKINVLAGSTKTPLPSTFKQLSEEKSPVSYTDASLGQSNVPVKVSSREKIESWWPWPWPFGPILVPIPGSYLPIRVVFIENNNGVWELNIPPQFAASSTLVFNISAYWYPDDLKLATDHNVMTDNGDVAEALIHRTRAIAYFAMDPTDKRGVSSLAMYEQCYRTARYSDEKQRYGGRCLHG